VIRHLLIFRRRVSDEVPAFRGRGAAAGATGAGTAARAVAVVAMILVTAALGAPAPARAHNSSFTDVSPTEPAHDAVEYLAGADVISGYPDGTFHPGGALSRGQAAKMLVRQRGLAAESASRRFSDVDAAYSPYVETAADKGWITGYSDGTFRPYALLQRQHMAVIMVRSLGWAAAAEALTGSQVAAQLAAFSDAAGIATEARPYVALALARGLFKGSTDGRLSPGTSITRGQFSLVAYRAELRDLAVAGAIRVGTDYPDKTRVVFDLSAAPGTVTSRMSGSSVLVVDVSKTVAEGGGADASVGSPEVQRAATRQLSYRPQVMRITLTLDRFSRFEIATLPPSDGKGYRILVDVFKRTDGPPSGPPLIALDAGHGGSDPGAIGVTGVKEKDVNLAITLEVDKILREAGLRTILTRSDDSYPTLQERTDLANQAQATIFVSIHNNAAGDPASEGTETFYWGTDAQYSVEGKRLAEAIQRNLIASLSSDDRGARTHWLNLHVLAETHMTAALTEVGFLTNAEEEAKLNDPAYQGQAAAAVARGILEYLGWSPSSAPAGG
jgi:N-acetylmuramoyl-L-alanine amidase